MSEVFLSEGWLAELAARGARLPEAPGVDMVVQHEVAGAPDGKVRFWVDWRDGRITDVRLGKHPEPDIYIQAKAADALRMVEGELSADVGFMQGRLKVDGDYRKLIIDLRDWRTSDEHRAMCAAMAELTA